MRAPEQFRLTDFSPGDKDKPKQGRFTDYIPEGSDQIVSAVYKSANSRFSRLRWRKDRDEGIHGGRRRTYIPHPRRFIDYPVFGGVGGYVETMLVIASAANKVSADLGLGDWRANRLITNFLQPNETITPHTDPEHFRDGVIVFGIGEAVLKFGDFDDIHNPHESITFIPHGVEHSVQNGDETRISIVAAHDTQLADGQTATGQFLNNWRAGRAS